MNCICPLGPEQIRQSQVHQKRTQRRRIAAAVESRVEVNLVPLSKATSDFGSARDNKRTPKFLE
jgi:hypothetical protein